MPYADGNMEPPCVGLTAEARPEDLYQMGLVYATGQGVAEDLVAAHKWFNLAALKGSEEAKIQRREIADMLSTDEIGEALKAAREWLRLMN
ncbi:MAG: hypothetical protein AAGJ29_01725 [Pseudomonadota bacterium]